jgi:hypothetical protein
VSWRSPHIEEEAAPGSPHPSSPQPFHQHRCLLGRCKIQDWISLPNPGLDFPPKSWAGFPGTWTHLLQQPSPLLSAHPRLGSVTVVGVAFRNQCKIDLLGEQASGTERTRGYCQFWGSKVEKWGTLKSFSQDSSSPASGVLGCFPFLITQFLLLPLLHT